MYSKRFLFLVLLFLICNNIFAQSSNLTTTNIKFVSNNDTLSGTIIKPAHPVAAIVTVHGSGQEKRMTEFAMLLANNGIAVITYDKRGVGESGGVYAGPEVGTNNVDSANLNLLASDAVAAGKTLLASLSDKKIPLGLIGASQAGWIIPLAAKAESRFNYMVIFSGALITVKEQLRFQFYTNGNKDFWNTHTEADARDHIHNDADRYEFVDTDPRETISKLSIPGLWIFGGRDIQVPVNLSIENLIAAQLKNKLFTYKLYPELGHNTAFTKDKDPVETAIKWIKERKFFIRKN